MISSHRISTITILSIFIGTIHGYSIIGTRYDTWEGGGNRKRKQRHKKIDVQSKKWCPSLRFFYVLFSVIQSFLYGLSWSSHNVTASSKKNTSKKEPISLFEITIQYLHKNIIIPLLCQCGLFAHTCLSKNSIASKEVIIYLLWYKMIRWSSHISYSLSFYSFLCLVNNTAEVME